MPSLTAIVPATDAPPTLGRCLAAIEAAADPPEKILVIKSPPGAGPAEARNQGAAEAGGEILVFVDSDVLVHADAFRRIREGFDRDPGLSAIFGSYDLDSGRGGAVTAFRNLLHHHVHQQAAGPATSFWAGLGAVRRRDLLEARDIELGARLVGAGGRGAAAPGVRGLRPLASGRSWPSTTASTRCCVIVTDGPPPRPASACISSTI